MKLYKILSIVFFFTSLVFGYLLMSQSSDHNQVIIRPPEKIVTSLGGPGLTSVTARGYWEPYSFWEGDDTSFVASSITCYQNALFQKDSMKCFEYSTNVDTRASVYSSGTIFTPYPSFAHTEYEIIDWSDGDSITAKFVTGCYEITLHVSPSPKALREGSVVRNWVHYDKEGCSADNKKEDRTEILQSGYDWEYRDK